LAPNAGKISGPSAIRYLLTASEVYQTVIQDTVAVIQTAIEEGMVIERESQYAQLLLALTEVERALSWTAERSRVLLGEATEEPA
jgi:hypothetical protein